MLFSVSPSPFLPPSHFSTLKKKKKELPHVRFKTRRSVGSFKNFVTLRMDDGRDDECTSLFPPLCFSAAGRKKKNPDTFFPRWLVIWNGHMSALTFRHFHHRDTAKWMMQLHPSGLMTWNQESTVSRHVSNLFPTLYRIKQISTNLTKVKISWLTVDLMARTGWSIKGSFI